MTSSDILSNCLESDNRSSELAYKKWLKEFENILQRCFKKIRLTSKCEKSKIIKAIQNKSGIMEKIEAMKCFALDQNSIIKLNQLKIQLKESESLLCSLSSTKNAEIIMHI